MEPRHNQSWIQLKRVFLCEFWVRFKASFNKLAHFCSIQPTLHPNSAWYRFRNRRLCHYQSSVVLSLLGHGKKMICRQAFDSLTPIPWKCGDNRFVRWTSKATLLQLFALFLRPEVLTPKTVSSQQNSLAWRLSPRHTYFFTLICWPV